MDGSITGIMAENQLVSMSDGIGYADASGSISKHGWFENVYYNNGSIPYGPTKIDGKDYYFTGMGFVAGVGGYYNNLKTVYKDLKGNRYFFDSKGNKKQVYFKDGWNSYNGEWYFIGDSMNSYALTKINGSYYGLDLNGKMYKNQFLYSPYSFDYSVSSLYYVDENGNLTKGWKYIDKNWYYFGEDFKALKGIHKVDGKEYFFDKNGVMI